ncbi:hypothetical protein [Legionella lansingensis]|uniref:hypothetical protein n=1 Tax=Legionella lansingensis TaxID=45067 RepID=UPI0010418B2C|nr:hypothetical protein [Legionella lansingensis]
MTELEEQQNTVKKGDVIEEVKRLTRKGRFVIVNDAANSHRDGAAKYSKGSLEELFSRFTDQAIKLVLHFDDVHQRNADKGMSHLGVPPPQINVNDYQKRYLKMVLTIMSNLIKGEEYLESPQFFNDLFNAFPSADGLPIYFDMQNNAYEVPVDGGFFSCRVFKDTAAVKTMDKLLEHLDDPSYPIGMASFAAPDLRVLETTPLDTRATSNRILANPTEEGTLGYMIDQGISFQCEQAIAMAKKATRPVHVLFVLPGCGAFKNPEKIAAAHFVSTIKYYEEQFAENKISFNIVEYNARLAGLLDTTYQSVGKELSELNKAIHQTKNPLIKNRAIAVRESILSLYDSGNAMTDLIPLITATTNLLRCKPEEKASLIGDYKKLVENFHKQPDDLSHNLHAAMMKFVSGIARFFGIKHFDKDAAFKDSANELTSNLSDKGSTPEDSVLKL